MVLVELKNVDFGYTEAPVVRGLNLAVQRGEIVSIMGPSGCGKSTVLRLIAGLERPTSGSCYFGQRQVEQPRRVSRLLRYSFQDYDAFPWRTVRQNLLLGGASEQGSPRAFAVDDLLKKIGLAEHERKYPAELSGGMRKGWHWGEASLKNLSLCFWMSRSRPWIRTRDTKCMTCSRRCGPSGTVSS